MVFLHTAGDAKKARPGLARMTETCKSSASVCTNFLSLSTVGNIILYFKMNEIWLLPCRLLPRMHLARSCLNGLQKLYNLMVFLHTAGDAKKARLGLARMTETCKSSASVCTNFLSLSTVGNIILYFKMNEIWLLPCRLLPRMHLARSCLNGLQKLYNLMVFLHTAGDAKKARLGLARMTETCKSSASVCTNFLSLSTVGNIIFLF